MGFISWIFGFKNTINQSYTTTDNIVNSKITINGKSIVTNSENTLKIDGIEIKIKDHEQKTGMKIRVAAIDYLEKIRSHISDATASTGYNAARIADMTRDNDLATILLLQTQKSAGDPSDPLLSMRKVKGASVIEQDCRAILTKWRPGFNPDCEGINLDDKYSSIAIVKNNMGETKRIDLRFDGLTGKLSKLNRDEKIKLKEVEEAAKARKAQSMSNSTRSIIPGSSSYFDSNNDDKEYGSALSAPVKKFNSSFKDKYKRG